MVRRGKKNSQTWKNKSDSFSYLAICPALSGRKRKEEDM